MNGPARHFVVLTLLIGSCAGCCLLLARWFWPLL